MRFKLDDRLFAKPTYSLSLSMLYANERRLCIPEKTCEVVKWANSRRGFIPDLD